MEEHSIKDFIVLSAAGGIKVTHPHMSNDVVVIVAVDVSHPSVRLQLSSPILCMQLDINFCYIEEINGASNNYCNGSNTQYPWCTFTTTHSIHVKGTKNSCENPVISFKLHCGSG